MDKEKLLGIIDSSSLTYEAVSLMAWEVGAVDNIDDVARTMWHGGPSPPQASANRPRRFKLSEGDSRPDRKYWYFVKQEMYSLFCEDDPKYQELWDRLGKIEGKSTKAVVVVISGYIGEKAGVEGTILAGFVAVCLYGATKVSKEAFCNYAKENKASDNDSYR